MRTGWKSMFALIAPVALIVAGAYFLFQNADTGTAKGAVIYTAPRLAAKEGENAAQQLRQMPSHLDIPDAHISLDVTSGAFNSQTSTWTLDHTHAFFAQGTATPIIYSHDQKNLFSNLKEVSSNSKLYLTYENGSQLTLTYFATRFIDPNDRTILSEKNDGAVILMTCSGLSSEMRRIVYFKV